MPNDGYRVLVRYLLVGRAERSMKPTIEDFRRKLPRATWSIGKRRGKPRYLSLHYNGPPVQNRTPAGERAQLIFDAEYHMGPYLSADGLQYHAAGLSDGTLLQCRDWESILWHCGHKTGNAQSLAYHLPLGGNQDATPVQWESTILFFEWAMAEWDIPRQNVRGHWEWNGSACPGPHLKRRLLAWREDLTGRYEVIDPTGANVRQAPTTTATIATVYPYKHQFSVDSIKTGQVLGGDNIWLHSVDGLGFIHRSTVRKLS